MESDGFSNTPPNAIAIYGAAQDSTDGQTDTYRGLAGSGLLRTPEIKSRKVSREMALALLIDTLKVGMLEKVRRFREFASWSAAHG